MKSFIPFLLAVLVSSCSATVPVKKEPLKAPPNVEQEFRAAQAHVKAGDSKKALARLKRLVQQNAESDLTDDAYFLMAQIHTSAQQLPEALAAYLSILNMSTSSPLESEALMRAASLQLKLNQPSEAERSLERLTKTKTLTPEQAFEVRKLQYESFNAQKKNLQALETLVALANSAPQAVDRERYKSLAQDVLNSRLSDAELREVADREQFGFLRASANLRYGTALAEQQQHSRARSFLAEAARLAPGTEIAERATMLMAQFEARNRIEPNTIGVVLPLSGKQAGIGYKALRGIQLGLGVYGRAPSGFRLAVIDSEGNPDTARRAVERLVQEDGVVAIIGGLLSKTVLAEASKAQQLGIPAIMLSQKSGVTQVGDYIFRNSLTSEMQVQYLVELAIGKLGMKNFAVLFPNDAYGIEFANLFWDEVRARGGSITGAQPYDPQETDFRGYVQRLVGTYYLEDRSDEYRLRAKAWAEKNPRLSARKSLPPVEDILPPIVDFDAVFIPDGAKAVGQIAPMLAYTNVSGVRLLGTNLWNSPALISRGQKFVENSVFVDSFLATDPAFLNSDFVVNFKSTFDEEPGLTEVQAFDSALILRQLIASGETSRQGLQRRISSLQNFPGALGRLSVNGEREFRRPLAALTVKDSRVSNLDQSQH